MASSDNMIAAARDETWAFRTSFDNSWISEAFARDAEVLTKALHNSICNNTGNLSNNGGADDVSFADLLRYETPSSQQQQTQTQSVSSSGGGSEPETVSKRSSSTAALRNAVPPSGKITKRKSRASKRSPTTFITADPENFRQMVQQVTGVRFAAGSGLVGAVLKPEPQRPAGVVNRLQTGCLLPTLDTSAFLLDHQQQVGGPNTMEFGPPAVVAQAGSGPGFDFDGFSGFPTLESQAWIN